MRGFNPSRLLRWDCGMFNCLGPRVEFSSALMHHGENKAELLQRREEWGRKSKVVALLFTTFVMLPALSSKVSLTRSDSSPSGLLRLMNDEFKYQGIQNPPPPPPPPPGLLLEKGICPLDTLSGCLASQTLIKAWRDKQLLTAMTDWSRVVFLSRPGILSTLSPQSKKFVLPVKNCFISNGSLYWPLTVTDCCCSAARYLQHRSLWIKPCGRISLPRTLTDLIADWHSAATQQAGPTLSTKSLRNLMNEENFTQWVFKFDMKTEVQKIYIKYITAATALVYTHTEMFLKFYFSYSESCSLLVLWEHEK